MRNVQTIPTIKPFPSLPLHHAHCPWYPQHVMAWTHAMVLTLNNRKRASWGQRSPRLWISVCYFCLAHAPFLSKKICQFDTVTAPMLHCLSLLIGTQSFAVGPEKGFWKTIQGQGLCLCLCLFSWLEFRVLQWVQRERILEDNPGCCNLQQLWFQGFCGFKHNPSFYPFSLSFFQFCKILIYFSRTKKILWIIKTSDFWLLWCVGKFQT